MNVLENEYHFILVCPYYRELRNTILPKYYCKWPTRQKFVQLLKCQSTIVMSKLAKFTYKAFIYRQKENDNSV